MREPTFPLKEAATMFLEDVSFEIRPTTWQTYRSWVMGFAARHAKLRDLNPLNAEAFIRSGKSQHTRMNRAIALRRWAGWLADKKMWYESAGDQRLSVLREVKQPRPSQNGQPPYTDDEIRAILRAVTDGPLAFRNRAVAVIELHGLRAREACALQRRNLILPTYKEKGHLVIEDSKTTSGFRSRPLGDFATEPLKEYLRERPTFRGSGVEPFFLTDDARAFTPAGFHVMAQRLRRMVKAETGIAFKQHRLRSTSVRLAHEAEWPDSVIIAAHGWSARTGQQMLARYRGPVPVEQMKRYRDPFERIARAV